MQPRLQQSRDTYFGGHSYNFYPGILSFNHLISIEHPYIKSTDRLFWTELRWFSRGKGCGNSNSSVWRHTTYLIGHCKLAFIVLLLSYFAAKMQCKTSQNEKDMHCLLNASGPVSEQLSKLTNWNIQEVPLIPLRYLPYRMVWEILDI